MSDRSKYLYSKTVKGRGYLYFRDPTGKLISLPTDQGSPEFRTEYDACMRNIQPKPTAQPEAKAAAPYKTTVNAAIDKYEASPEFAKLKPHTLRGYNNAIKGLRATFGSMRLKDIDSDRLEIYTEEVTAKHRAAVADRVLTVYSKIWKVARKFEDFGVKKLMNPTTDAERRYTVKRAHRAWSHEAEQAVLAVVPENVRVAMLLLHFAAQRGGDCIKMRWSDFDGRGLLVRPEKTDGEAEAEPHYHLCPQILLDALHMAPRSAETILVNELGTPYANSGVLSNAIRRGLKAAGIKGLTMHGLRKSAARDVAELGVGVAGIKSVTGHRTDEMAEYYAQGANMRRANQEAVEKWNDAIERRSKFAVVAGTERKAS